MGRSWRTVFRQKKIFVSFKLFHSVTLFDYSKLYFALGHRDVGRRVLSQTTHLTVNSGIAKM